MKAFHKIIGITILIFFIITITANILLLNQEKSLGREYRVQINRLCQELAENEQVTLEKYPLLTNLIASDSPDTAFLEGGNADYVIRKIDDTTYRIEYKNAPINNNASFVIINTCLGIMGLFILALLLYLRTHLIKRFELLKEVPYQLSKGNLTVPLSESKSRFFGRFVWGMDLLREKLEQQKQEELKLHKEKKTMILSISHDIKTPLSAIKLYAKALSKGLYTEHDRQLEIAESINNKADEIENYVTQIIKASKEDFLSLEVNNQEFYLSEILSQLTSYYSDKLRLLKIDFRLTDYTDCLLYGDANRAVEVLQNIIENAIKYGDGSYIQISFSDEENCRLITVSNSGCTLPDNELPHVFDSFFRGSNATNNSGSGLGLYICRQLMNKMNGDIFAKCDSSIMHVTAVFKKA